MKLPHLNLRDLFWLILVCALGLGSWVREVETRSRLEASWTTNDGLRKQSKTAQANAATQARRIQVLEEACLKYQSCIRKRNRILVPHIENSDSRYLLDNLDLPPDPL